MPHELSDAYLCKAHVLKIRSASLVQVQPDTRGVSSRLPDICQIYANLMQSSVSVMVHGAVVEWRSGGR